MLITSVKPNITREQAITKFGWRLRRLKYGELRFAFDFYIPYRIFQATWDDGRSKSVAFLAADSVTGKLDLIEFDQLPAGGEIMNIDTPMVAKEHINDDEEAHSLVRERILELTFKKKGFFKLSRLNVVAEMAARSHLPYWVGIYERDGQAHIEVINAMRGRFEGAKLRDIVAEWFQ